MIETVEVVGVFQAQPGPAGPGNAKKSMTPRQAIFRVFLIYHRHGGSGGENKLSETIPHMNLPPIVNFFRVTSIIRRSSGAFSAKLNGGRPDYYHYYYWPAGPGEKLKM